MATINSHGLILREWEAVLAAIEANPELVPLVEEQRETLRLPPLRPLLPRDGQGH